MQLDRDEAEFLRKALDVMTGNADSMLNYYRTQHGKVPIEAEKRWRKQLNLSNTIREKLDRDHQTRK